MDLYNFCLIEKSCHLHDYEGLHGSDSYFNIFVLKGEILNKNGSLSIVGHHGSEPVPIETLAHFLCDKQSVYPSKVKLFYST